MHSDGYMNITMEDVLFTDALGHKSKFDSFFVQNRLIRCNARLFFCNVFLTINLSFPTGLYKSPNISIFKNPYRLLHNRWGGGGEGGVVTSAEEG